MPSTELTLAFADGEYRFRLGLAQLAAIEDRCGPIGEVYSRLMRGRYLVDGHPLGNAAEAAFKLADVQEVIRHGLIGGGAGLVNGLETPVGPLKADALCRDYITSRPLLEGWSLAVAILGALMEGFTPPKAPPAKPAGKGKKATGG